jgi:hypothetical protein
MGESVLTDQTADITVSFCSRLHKVLYQILYR